MHDHAIHQLSGPDFLESVADAEAANDNLNNAHVYGTRAKEWRDDKAEIQRLQHALENATLELAKAARTDRTPRLPRHAITPSGRR